MTHGAVFGEHGGEEWDDEERERLARNDWQAVLEHPDIGLHTDAGGRYSLHRRGVLVVAEEDVEDERLVANLDDLGIRRSVAEGSRYEPDQGIERTGVGFAVLSLGSNVDAVAAAGYLRTIEGRRPLRAGPDHLLSPSQGGVLGPGAPPRPARPGRGVLAKRSALAEVVPSVPVAVIDSGLVAGELADPLLGAGLTTSTAGVVIEPDPLWDGAQLLHWEGGHGTHVAGVLAAAAEGHASILHFAVLEESGLPVPLVSDTRVAVAVARALSAGCRVINLSLSGPTAADYDTIATGLVLGRTAGSAQARRRGDACTDDAVLVAAAGNEATSVPRYPAALKGVVGVGALDARGTGRARFSNFGPWVDCATLGEGVFGPYVTGAGGPLPDGAQPAFKGWARWSGTSFAAPYVAGLVAATIAAGTTSARLAAATVLARGVPLAPELGLGVKVS